jgi:hypothetical protein
LLFSNLTESTFPANLYFISGFFPSFLLLFLIPPLGADYTSNFVGDFMCDLLNIADAICCICDLVSDKNSFLSFLAPNRRCDLVCDSVSLLQLRRNRACTKLHAQNCTQNRTLNHMLRVIGNNSVSDTKSQMQQIASAICSKSHMKLHTCNQPLSWFATKNYGENAALPTRHQVRLYTFLSL